MLLRITSSFKRPHLAWIGALVFVLAISALAHGINMFGFPYYENDEGVYMSQAWSLITSGKLAPYTYWYDHAPAGWMFIALWTLLTGGFYTFGFSLNSGRVFMLVLQVASTFLLMLITKKLTKSTFAAVIAGLIFSLSPLGIYFHRRVLLDNIMTFWVLLSYVFVLHKKLKLNHVILSALFFGIAVLTKENAIFFIPGFLASIYFNTHKHNRLLALSMWVFVCGSIVSLYFAYALLKGELFPTGALLGGNQPHVSLLETLKYQSSRGGGSIFDIENSSFWRHFYLWMNQDSLIMSLGIFSNLAVFTYSIIKKNVVFFSTSLLGAFFWFFLIRGGIVIEFYIIPLIPILCILSSILISVFMNLFKMNFPQHTVNSLWWIVLISFMSSYLLLAQESKSFSQNSSSHRIFQSKQTSSQRDAVYWIRNNLSEKDTIIIDNYAYLDLNDSNNPSGIVFDHAKWYWKVDFDPEIKLKLLQNNPEYIDVIAVTPQMSHDLLSGTSPLTSQALENSKFWKSFELDGWGVQFWRPYYPRHILKRSWDSYKNNFMQNGRVLDPTQDITTSEGQSYALLRAVWMDDKITFDEVLRWTNEHLTNEQSLFSWKFGRNELGVDEVLDAGSATDADQDIALALLFAHKQWDEQVYLTQARQIIMAIWKYEVKEFDKEFYLLPGNWAKDIPGVQLNPSYFAPYAYRIFQQVEPNLNWESVIESGYKALHDCSQSNFSEKHSVFLPPEWCLISPAGNVVVSNAEGLQDTNYGYNAFRIPWRIAVDYEWNKDPRALAYLENLDFLQQEWQENNKLLATYTHEGEVGDNYESVAAYATNLAVFKVLEPDQADTMYQSKIKEKFFEDDSQSYWDDPTNYYNQNWAWFGTALYADLLPNLWE